MKMGKAKDTIYKEVRTGLGLTREEACEKSLEIGKPIQRDRLERIENGRFEIEPDEVMLLAEIYGEPTLCNHYCSNECPIGQKYVPEIKVKDLTRIVMETLSLLNSLQKRKERLIDISADGIVDDEEIKDFVFIQNELEKISITVETLQFWVEEMFAEGKIDIEKYNKYKNN